MNVPTDRLFLVAGIAGLVAAVIGAVGLPKPQAFGLDAAVIVNGRPIPKEAAARAVEALRADKRNPVTPADEAAALERLIEEELLVQRGVELGLAETDLAARKALVQSVLALALSDRAGAAPTEATLRAFYRENAGLFAGAPRVQARLVFIAKARDGNARARAAETALRAGRPAAPLGDETALVLPAAPLGFGELRTYVGGPLAQRVLAGKPGDVIVEERPDGWRLVRVESWIAPPAPRYEDVAEQVRAEWDRRADEEAVRAYIEDLKRRARITRGA